MSGDETKDIDAEDYWEARYQAASPSSSGQPGLLFRQSVESLAAGRALELGCARGDDAVWLAKRGWAVVAVDISATVLGYAAANAQRAGVAERITFERHDLSQSFPAGRFDLVTASFLQSPVEFPRDSVLRRAADSVSEGGCLLIIEHASGPSWSAEGRNMQFPVAEETFDGLALQPGEWVRLRVEVVERSVTGPEGQPGTVRDNIIFLRKAAHLLA